MEETMFPIYIYIYIERERERERLYRCQLWVDMKERHFKLDHSHKSTRKSEADLWNIIIGHVHITKPNVFNIMKLSSMILESFKEKDDHTIIIENVHAFTRRKLVHFNRPCD
jgi:hypothetical protein